MRFIHAADIHLDSPLRGLDEYPGAPVERVRSATRAALKNLVDLCLTERVDFLVIAGDLFDHDWRDFRTPLFAAHQLQRLERERVPVFLILGNHDSHQGMSRNTPWPRNVHVLDHKKPETKRLDELKTCCHRSAIRTMTGRWGDESLRHIFQNHEIHPRSRSSFG